MIVENKKDMILERDLLVLQGCDKRLANVITWRDACDKYERWGKRAVFKDEVQIQPSFEDELIDKLNFEQRISILPDSKKCFVILYFVYGYTLKEIGKMNSYGESRASQIKTAILNKLREKDVGNL